MTKIKIILGKRSTISITIQNKASWKKRWLYQEFKSITEKRRILELLGLREL